MNLCKATAMKMATVFGAAIFIALFTIGVPLQAQDNPPSTPGAGFEAMKADWRVYPPISATLAAGPVTAEQADVPDKSGDRLIWTEMTYQQIDSDNWNILLKPSIGTASTPLHLTTHPGNDVRPRLHTPSRRVVFVSDRDGNAEIYTVDTQGNNLQRLTNTGGRAEDMPSWSPDGSQIAFVSDRNGNVDIFVMNADGSNQRRLTNAPEDDIYPAWSPDGERIAWVRANDDYRALFIMNADGSGQRAIAEWLDYLGNPTWSPDGSQILVDYDMDRDYMNELVAFSPDSSTPTLIYDANGSVPYNIIDLGASAWEDGYIILNWYEYEFTGSSFKLSLIAVRRLLPSGSNGEWKVYLEGFDYHNALYGDAGLLDTEPPTSRLKVDSPYARMREEVNLSWTGRDSGPAGVQSYLIESRFTDDADWQYVSSPSEDIHALTDSPYLDEASQPTQIFYRIRAQDNAENIEAWPQSPAGDSSAFLFEQFIRGEVSDIRGMPLDGYEVQTDETVIQPPVMTDPQGRYVARFYTWDMGIEPATGYINPRADIQHPLYAAESDSTIFSDNFETASPEWRLTGPAQRDQRNPYGGQYALSLGDPDCLFGCAHPIPFEFYEEPISAKVGVRLFAFDGHAYMLSTQQRGFRLRIYAPDGEFVDKSPLQTSADAHEILDGAFDNQGNLHLVWRESNRDKGQVEVRYSQWMADSDVWLPPVVVNDNFPPSSAHYYNWIWASIDVDEYARPHVLYYDCAPFINRSGQCTLYYRQRSSQGRWSEAESYTIPDPGDALGGVSAAIAVDKETLHMAWTATAYYEGSSYEFRPLGLFYAAINLDEPWQVSPKRIRSGKNVIEKIWIDDEGVINLVGDRWHTRLNDPAQTPRFEVGWNDSDVAPPVYIGGNGQAIFISSRLLDDGYPPYRSWTSAGGWTDPSPIALVETLRDELHKRISVEAAATDQDGRFFAIYSASDYNTDSNTEWYLGMPALTSNAEIAQLSRMVTIPEDMHKPTLAFLYSLHGPLPEAALQVSVTDSLTTTEIFSATGETQWVQGWADISPWAGETITVTFQHRQRAGAPLAMAQIDNVSISAWKTAQVIDVAPRRVAAGIATHITISGENFIETPVVWLDDHQLEEVMWVDEQSIDVTVPASIKPGRYALKVRNPGSSFINGSWLIAVGKETALPLISNSQD